MPQIRKILPAAVAMLMLAGCAVQAEDTVSTYYATVISEENGTAVLLIEENADSVSCDDEWKPGDTVTVDGKDRILVFRNSCTENCDDLSGNEHVLVSFSHGHAAAIHVIEDDSSSN